MAKLKSSFLNMVLSLTLICVITSGLLATTYMFTSGPIAKAEALALQEAIQQVCPEYDNNPVDESYTVETTDGYELLVYPAAKDGKPAGAAVESSSKNGFSGLIKIIVGFDTEGNILNYSVLQHNETPGLGSKMQEWFRTNKNKQNIIGCSMAKGNLVVTKDGGDIDAITASTITSRAFLEAINRAYNAYLNVDATSSASAVKTKEGGNNE